MKVTMISIVVGALETVLGEKRAERIGGKRENLDHQNYCIVEIGQNTEKRPEETCRRSNSCARPPANDVVKSYKR